MHRSRLLAIGAIMLAVLIAPTQLLAQESTPDAGAGDAAVVDIEQVLGQAGGATPAPDPTSPPASAAPASAAAPPATAAPDPATEENAQARLAQGSGQGRAAKAVTIADFSFTPASITVQVGDTVTWTNNGPTAHSATADDKSFDTGVFPAGQSRSHTFNQAGSFSYICTPHPNMKGTVIVEAASTGGNAKNNSTTPSSGTAGVTESAAVAAPDAAGSATQLPATGSDPLALAIAGALLLLAGLLARRPARS